MTPWMEKLSEASREAMTALRDSFQPKITVSGHMRVRTADAHADGTHDYALAGIEHAGNIGILDLPTMRWTWLDDLTQPAPRSGRL